MQLTHRFIVENLVYAYAPPPSTLRLFNARELNVTVLNAGLFR